MRYVEVSTQEQLDELGADEVAVVRSGSFVARGSSHVVARDSSHVEAWGSSHLARHHCPDAVHFLACKVRVADMVMLDDKVKVPSCTVLHEVDLDGREVPG